MKRLGAWKCGWGQRNSRVAVQTYGFVEVFRTYIVPQMIANFYLCAITFMQHTHPDVPHFNEDQWTWLRGALSTIDRSMGSFADYKTHYIVPSHVVHHIFSDMPYYGALEATPYVAAHLGKYYKRSCARPTRRRTPTCTRIAKRPRQRTLQHRAAPALPRLTRRVCPAACSWAAE